MSRKNPLNEKILNRLLKDIEESGEIENFKKIKEEDLILLHPTLGRYIRNTFMFGKENKSFMKDYSGENEDELSFEIIQNFQKYLNGDVYDK